VPTISVCLPVYNGAAYLAEAIASVLGQTHTDFELLIADDCSSDDSLSIAQRLAENDTRLRVWRNERNLGLFANYNNCIQRATGQYIKLFAQDDLLAPAMLVRQIESLEKNPSVKLVSTAKRWIGSAGQELQVLRPFPETRLVTGHDVIRYNMMQLTNWVGEPSTVMFRRKDAGAGFDKRFYHYGDIEYWFRIVESGDYLYLDEVLCDFRRHEGSSTKTNLSGMFFALDIILLGKLYASYCEEIGESSEHFNRRALEIVARQVSELIGNEGLKASDVVKICKDNALSADEQLAAFKELSFLSLAYLSQLLGKEHSLLCTIQDLDEMVQEVRRNPVWRATAPFRQVSGSQVPGVDSNVPKISSGKPARNVVTVNNPTIR
jgi:glycosyltransferase involved in cell wall biosynthesis